MNTTDTAAREAFEAYLRRIKFPVLPVWHNGKPHQNYALELMWQAWQAALATHPQTDGATMALTDEQIINIADSYSFTWDEGIIAFARALLATTHAPAMAETQVPEGFALVPLKPNDAMQLAGAEAVRMDTTALNRIWTANAVFRAMVGAAASGGELGS